MAIGGEFTSQLIAKAGISSGDCVLDYGCGNGDVCLLLAQTVGPQGRVLGIDQNPESLEMARERAETAGLANIEFRQIDLGDVPNDLGEFDAMIGRRILLYLTEPVQVVRSLMKHLKVDGVFASHEHDTAFDHPANGAMPAHRRAKALVIEMLAAENARDNLGPELPHLLTAAGLKVSGAIASAILQTPNSPYPIGAMLMASKARLAAAKGVSEDDLNLDELIASLEQEQSAEAFYWADTMYGAWGTKR
ncbi:methyltransferase domain-containing protein [Erythrobacter crassostreae]|uniref:Methyltransferase domain-containing protein n=1 Tax=Erythrobacter crassostreae TaxID=2828328 RepID=A0A9X1F3S2_9SPHN|nr:methyltransferase domain-containing protein [Erythrobacter crassostrea]